MNSMTKGRAGVLISSFYAGYSWLYSYSRLMWP
jgi:hypothetical protein